MLCNAQDSDVQTQTTRATLSFEDLGYTNVMTNRGAVTTRCKKSTGWEDPTQIDPHLMSEFQMIRACKTPTVQSPEFRHRDAVAAGFSTGQFTSRDPWGSRAGKRSSVLHEFGAVPHKVRLRSCTSTSCCGNMSNLP